MTFLIIAFTFGYFIFKNKGVQKLPWFFAGILFFPPAITLISSPHVPFQRLIILFLFAATIIQYRNWWYVFSRFPVKNTLIILFFYLLIVGFFDERLNLFLKIYRPLNYFIENFLIFFLTYFYIRDRKDVVYIYKKLLIMFLILCIYGLCNLFTGQSEYMRLIVDTYGGFDSANLNMVEGRSRFRIASFTHNPIYYGFLLNVMLLLMMFIFNASTRIRRKYFYGGIFLLLFLNLFLVNSRTPLLACTLGLTLYVFFGINFREKIKIITSISIIIGLTFVVFPNSFAIVEKTIQTFSSDSQPTEGSSIEMRKVQLAASVELFLKQPIKGHGFNYIRENLGYSGDKDENRSDSDLKGFESYIYFLLIEHGLIGIICNVIFFISCIGWLFSSLNDRSVVTRKLVILSVGMFFSFLFFIIGTGALGTFLFFLSVMGIQFRAIQLFSSRNIISQG